MPGPDAASARERHIEKTLKAAAPCFQSAVFGRIAFEYSQGELFRGVELLFNNSHANPSLAPRSVKDFLAKTSHIFTTEFSQNFKFKCRAFDEIVGGKVAGPIMKERTLLGWTRETIIRTMQHFEEATRGDDPPFLFSPARLVSWAGRNRRAPPAVALPDCAAPDHAIGSESWLHVLRRIDQYREFRLPAPITQISLRGPSLAEAWAADPMIFEIPGYEKLVMANWTSSTPAAAVAAAAGSLAVGTLGPLAAGAPGSVCDKGPVGHCTSHSALMSTLWSMFSATVMRNPPGPGFVDPLGPGFVDPLQHEFRFRGQALKGVLLLCFDRFPCVPAGISLYDIPLGRAGAWRDALHPWIGCCGSVWSGAPRQEVGTRSCEIHGQHVPLAVQGTDSLPTSSSMPCPMAWLHRRALTLLSENLVHVYAISYEQVDKDEAEGEAEDEE